MAIRNFQAVVKEKDLDLSQIARDTGIQQSILELIMIGAYVSDIDFRIKICEAIGEPFNNELFVGGMRHYPPLR
jgi:hypothetical protein